MPSNETDEVLSNTQEGLQNDDDEKQSIADICRCANVGSSRWMPQENTTTPTTASPG